MSNEEEKNDPFKPQQPRIPGLSNEPVDAPVAVPSGLAMFHRGRGFQFQMPPLWIMLALGGALFIGIIIARWTGGSAPIETLSWSVVVLQPPADPPKPVEKLPVGPGPVAKTDELAKPWSSRRFTYQNSLTSETLPAIVVHLPNGTNWAISLREPYGHCTLEYIEDLGRLQSEYGFRAEHPMVGDPCNRSLFDLEKYGPGPSGLVRGQIIKGVAVRPPMAIEIRTKGEEIIALRME